MSRKKKSSRKSTIDVRKYFITFFCNITHVHLIKYCFQIFKVEESNANDIQLPSTSRSFIVPESQPLFDEDDDVHEVDVNENVNDVFEPDEQTDEEEQEEDEEDKEDEEDDDEDNEDDREVEEQQQGEQRPQQDGRDQDEPEDSNKQQHQHNQPEPQQQQQEQEPQQQPNESIINNGEPSELDSEIQTNKRLITSLDGEIQSLRKVFYFFLKQNFTLRPITLLVFPTVVLKLFLFGVIAPITLLFVFPRIIGTQMNIFPTIFVTQINFFPTIIVMQINIFPTIFVTQINFFSENYRHAN